MEGDELDRTLHLFLTHAHDAELHIRHTAALDKLCKGHCGNGFAVRDLPRVTEILDCTLDLVLSQHAAIFLGPACSLIRALGRPYVKQSSTDELRLLGAVSGLLSSLARVFHQELPWQVQACTAEVLAGFASVWGNRLPAPAPQMQATAELDLHSVQRVYQTHQSLLYESQIVPAVCSALQQAASSAAANTGRGSSWLHEAGKLEQKRQRQQQQRQEGQHPVDTCGLLAALVSTLLEFSFSQHLCGQALEAGVLPVLTQILEHEAAAGTASQLSTQVIELLWNLFDLAADTADRVAASSSSSSSSSSATATQQHLQGAEMQEQQQVTQEPHNDQCSQEEQQEQASANGEESPGRVAQQLVVVLTKVLQQQAAVCSSLQGQQQRNDTLTVLYLLSNCSSYLPAIVSNSDLIQHLLEAAAPTAADQAGAVSFSKGAGSGTAVPCISSHSGSLEVAHSRQLLAWGILGNAAAAVEPCLDSCVQAGLLQLLLDATAYGVPVSGRGSSSSAEWLSRLSPEQLSASKQSAWSTLQQVAPCCRASFITYGGINVLLDSLTAASVSTGSTTWLATSPVGPRSPGKAGSSSLAGRSCTDCSSCSSAEPALRLLRHLVRADAAMAAAVASEGGVVVLLQLLEAPAAATLTPIRQGVLLCLSELCSAGGHGCMTAVRDADGVGLLLKQCQSILDGDPYVPSLAALDALWRCCIHSRRSRAQLLAADGMDVLLGLLQRGNPALQPVLLSLLADLLADPRSHSFFWEWHAPAAANGSGWGSSSSSFSVPRARPPSGNGAAAAGALQGSPAESAASAAAASVRFGVSGGSQPENWLLTCCSKGAASLPSSNSITAAQLLISVWRQQDEALGISGPEGVIANPARPLSGCNGATGGARRPAARSSSAGHGSMTTYVDAYGLMLPDRQLVLERIAQAGAPHSLLEKVYACFAALGVAASKDSSAVSPDGLHALQQLPACDAATLAVIQQYTAFRQGEVWQDIRADFIAAGLQVTQEDSMRLESGIHHAEVVAAQVQATQAALLGDASAQQLAMEKLLYDNMAAQAAADAKAKVYEKDCSKLTMRERLAAKARKEDMLRHSGMVPQAPST